MSNCFDTVDDYDDINNNNNIDLSLFYTRFVRIIFRLLQNIIDNNSRKIEAPNQKTLKFQIFIKWNTNRGDVNIAENIRTYQKNLSERQIIQRSRNSTSPNGNQVWIFGTTSVIIKLRKRRGPTSKYAYWNSNRLNPTLTKTA